MPLPADTVRPSKSSSRRVIDTVKVWNRKSHYYLGLYFLLFLWLFAFTGLLLNHSWKFAEFWPDRTVSTYEREIEVPASGSDLDRARGILRQLGIRGEIEWTAVQSGSTLFEFRVNRPGHNFSVAVDQDTGRAKVEETKINGWGIMRVLHTFTGVRAADTRNHRDWILTAVWVFSMDAVSAGLIVMVLSGLYMWYGLPAKRTGGVIALLSGTAVCAVFVFGLRWLYS
jgi:hypothetical protein